MDPFSFSPSHLRSISRHQQLLSPPIASLQRNIHPPSLPDPEATHECKPSINPVCRVFTYLQPRGPLMLFFASAPLCRHGMRDDCPVPQCHFRNTKPLVLYSSAIKEPTPATPAPGDLTTANGLLAQLGTHDKFSGETYRFQHETAAPLNPTVNDFLDPFLSRTSNTASRVGMGPVDPMDGSGLAQGRSALLPSYFQPLMSPQLQISSRYIVSGYKVKWILRWPGSGR
jgi:hypothetical protein